MFPVSWEGCQVCCSCELRFSLLLGVLYCADIGESGFFLFCPGILQIACWVHRGCFLISRLKPLFSIVTYFFHSCYRRVAAFEAKQNQPKDQQKAAAKLPGQAGCRYQGLSKEDRAIAERLERLREERKPSKF